VSNAKAMTRQFLLDQKIPTFFLYEDDSSEPEAVEDFVHIETIRARASLHNWAIRPHRHSTLHQFLLLLEGSAQLDAEGRFERLAAPCLVVVPASVVHGFAFDPGAEGFILTVADRFLADCVERGAEPLPYPNQALAWTLAGARDSALLRAAFEFLHGELSWRDRGKVRAASACLELLLVATARRVAQTAAATTASPARVLAARFKALVNSHAPEGWSVQDYARTLGVSVDRLNRSCRAAAARSPIQIVHDRLLAEAKRGLIYTSMSVQEVGFSLGFADPAYFTRFFAQREGCSPSQFRQRMQRQDPPQD
jgi:AraC family transcriptional activator of pobA